MRRARATLGLATACLLVCQAAFAESAASVGALLDRAETLRSAHQTSAAAALVSQALKVDPKSFRARYEMGLIDNDRGDVKGAIMSLTVAIQSLGGAPAPDATIYNTLGWLYMSVGDVGDAEHWYRVGYANKSRLSTSAQQKLLNNLGNLYLIKGNSAAATRYFGEAAAKGNIPAQAILPKVASLPQQQVRAAAR